jgi:DNA processing protein
VNLTQEQRDLLALQLVPGIGPRLTTALLAEFGTAGAVLRATAEGLRRVPHIGPKLAADFHAAMRRLDLDAELAALERHNVWLVQRGEAAYPPLLSEIPDPPLLLYVRGTLLPPDARAVAIVGSRQCTAYGRRIAERLAAGLVQRGYTIVSGLARGIDAAAHRAALSAGGRTFAVLAGGLAKIYPPEHAVLAQEIEAQGALLSETAMTMSPMAGMFPARNRLISGLARAVLVVEAAERSGALITARHAGEQGRPVFAVPGPIDSSASGGANQLIREGAILVRGVEDVIEELEGLSPVRPPASKDDVSPDIKLAHPEPPDLSPVQRQVWEFLAEPPRHVDDITRQLGLPSHEVTSLLLMMEMKKLVRRLPGNLYERA